jgi:hypothetical protein
MSNDQNRELKGQPSGGRYAGHDRPEGEPITVASLTEKAARQAAEEPTKPERAAQAILDGLRKDSPNLIEEGYAAVAKLVDEHRTRLGAANEALKVAKTDGDRLRARYDITYSRMLAIASIVPALGIILKIPASGAPLAGMRGATSALTFFQRRNLAKYASDPLTMKDPALRDYVNAHDVKRSQERMEFLNNHSQLTFRTIGQMVQREGIFERNQKTLLAEIERLSGASAADEAREKLEPLN